MKIYAVHLSEDGLHTKCATNAKALFKIIEEVDYRPETVCFFDGKTHLEIPYNYRNIVAALKASSRDGKFYSSFRIECQNSVEIQVSELKIEK